MFAAEQRNMKLRELLNLNGVISAPRKVERVLGLPVISNNWTDSVDFGAAVRKEMAKLETTNK